MHPGRGLLRLTISALLAWAVVAFPAAARCQSTCPLNYLAIGYEVVPVYYQDAARETTLASSYAGYDLAIGEVRARGYGTHTRRRAEAGVGDEYVISGPSPGTSFTIQARLSITANIARICSSGGHCGFGNVRVVLTGGPGNEAAYEAHFEGNYAVDIGVPIQGSVGVPFTLGSSAFAQGEGINGFYGVGTVTALLDFVNLPAGSRITSCQGYVQDAPVPVLRPSWGRLKQSYR